MSWFSFGSNNEDKDRESRKLEYELQVAEAYLDKAISDWQHLDGDKDEIKKWDNECMWIKSRLK